MTRWRRLFVGALLAGVIGFQAYIALPPNDGAWWWPFLDYPMYATARYADDAIGFRRLEGVPCDGGTPVELSHAWFGVRWFRVDRLLESIVEDPGPEAASARADLRALARERRDRTICALRIHTRSVTLARLPPDGAEGIPWRPVAEVRVW